MQLVGNLANHGAKRTRKVRLLWGHLRAFDVHHSSYGFCAVETNRLLMNYGLMTADC